MHEYFNRETNQMLSLDSNPIDLPELILASGSPRRAEILASVGWQFTVQVPDINETELSGEPPDDYVRRLAGEKASAVAGNRTDGLILAADTTVVINGKIIGKPIDDDDARRMLRKLSGKWHEVLTGVAIVKGEKSLIDMQRTSVKFAEMTGREIDFLVERGDPLDKAGGYAVQAQAALFIEGIEGDYWNVVGLPVNLVFSMIKQMQVFSK